MELGRLEMEIRFYENVLELSEFARLDMLERLRRGELDTYAFADIREIEKHMDIVRSHLNALKNGRAGTLPAEH